LRWLFVASSLCAASAAEADALLVQGRGETLSPGGAGGGGGVEWQHALGDRRTLRVGGSAFTLPGAKWGSTTAGLLLPLGRTSASIDGTFGHGSLDGAYGCARGGLTIPVHPRLSLVTALQGIAGRSARGTLVETSAITQPSRSLTLQASYFASLRGTLGTRLAAAKAVVVVGRRRYLMGAALGSSTPSVFGVLDHTHEQRLRHLFVGTAVPRGKTGDEVLITVEGYDLQAARRFQFSLGWKLGLR
jgi:hypothetical protein